MPKPHEIIDTVMWWVSEQVDVGFEDGGTLQHGLQDDFMSCAFVTVNTMVHRIFNERLWDCSRAAYERARWFVKVVEAHGASVSGQT
jgi:hypothetical protein